MNPIQTLELLMTKFLGNDREFKNAVMCAPSIPEWSVDHRANCTIFTGNYVVFRPGGVELYQLPGRIVEWQGLPTDVYLYDPPFEIRQLPEGPCLQLVSPGGAWFKLHWQNPARTFSESRAHVERMLSQLPSRILIRMGEIQSFAPSKT